jgi:hypothetical protein
VASGLHFAGDMNRGRRAVLALGVGVLALSAALPACSDDRDWDGLKLPLLMWTQEEGSWEQPASHCMHTRVVDAEWNAWQDEWCGEGDGEVSPAGALSPAARETLRQGFESLKTAEPHGRFAVICSTKFLYRFSLSEPIPMLEEPTTSTIWETCGETLDDIANLEEPFATIAKAFLDR